jgi:hypothetical protein
MPFSLTSNPSLTEISDAINYLLNNFGSNVSIDLQTGIIAGPSGRISNLYKYISIKYATSYDGTVGFSNVPTNATYYGIRNSNSSTESTNPADYIWYKTTGFGTTNFLWYIVAGGRQIDFYLSATSPGIYYVKDPGTAIDIDIVTTTSTQNVAIPAIYQWTSGSAPARPSTTSTYTWATASYSAPSGWTTTPSSNSTPGYVQWAIFVPITANSNTSTSTIDWTNTSYPIVQFSANGATGSAGSTGLSSLTAYRSQSQTASAPSTPANTTGATAPSGWSLTAPSLTAGNILYYTFGQYNSSSGTINGIPAGQTQWGTPTAASVFQDILSDNWNGSIPMPSSGGTIGTSGYYLSKTSGNFYGTNGVFRGDISGATGTFAGSVSSTIYSNRVTLNETSTNWFSVYATGGSPIFTILGDGTNYVQAALNGNNNTLGAFRSSNSGTGAAIYGNNTSTGYGVYGQASGSGAAGVIGSNSSGAAAIYANGYYATNNNTLVNNLYANYARIMPNASATNQLSFIGGTSTGTGVSTFSGINKPGGNTTNTWMTIQIDATTLYIPVWT